MVDLTLPPSISPSPPARRAAVPDAAAALREAVGDLVLLPGEPGYDLARATWNLAVDQHPFAAARPANAAEVCDIVRAASALGLRVAPQSTGHGAAPLAESDLSDTVVIGLHRMRGATVDPTTRTARILGGSRWGDVLARTAPHGLTAVHGSSPSVSAVGYSLQGGVSFYARRHGLAVNHVRSVEMVTPGGDLVHASPSENPDLFWAVRGGAGAFGVVTSLEIDLLPYADVHAGMLLWDGSRAREVAHLWTLWTHWAPESVSTALRILQFPPIPELPPFLAGRTTVVVDGAILEDDEEAARLLAPLRALGPEIDTFARIPAIDLTQVHMDPPEPSAAIAGHTILEDLTQEAVDVFIDTAIASHTTISELRHIGGAARRESDTRGAITSLDGDYLLAAVTLLPDPAMAPAIERVIDAQVAALEPWQSGARTLTFLDGRADRAAAFGSSIVRLREIKRRIDPDGVMVGSHPLDGPLNSAG